MFLITCVIIHYGDSNLTSECIKSIEGSETSNFNIDFLVVDNTKINKGYAEGANAGIQNVLKNKATKYIFLLNNDVILKKNTLKKLLLADKSDKIGIIGPSIQSTYDNRKYYLSEGIIDRNRFTAGHNKKYHRETFQKSYADFLSGAALLIKREIFDKSIFFDKRYFLYYEDVDFCYLAKKYGYSSLLEPKSVVVHKESSSVADFDKNYYLARNHLLFMEKYAPWKVKAREMIRIPKTIYEHMSQNNKGGLKGVKDYFLRRFGKVKL